jgi:ABC-2 type transport system ATP-binding protein
MSQAKAFTSQTNVPNTLIDTAQLKRESALTKSSTRPHLSKAAVSQQPPRRRGGPSIVRLLEVSHLRKTFNGNVVAVEDLSFHVNQGEIFGLVGPNGAGKTTTMTMLAGLLKPDSGTIHISGQPFDPSQYEHRSILGMVPQNLAIYPDLSANENLEFFGGMYGLRGNKLKQRMDAVLELTGLTERSRSLVKTFSGGMKRRLNFGVALLHEPRLVILDEPTVGVDPQSRSHLLDAVLQLSRDGVSILYASHYMEEVEGICHRVAILDDGRLVECGTLPELLSNVNRELRLCVSPPSPMLIERLQGLAQVRQSSDDELIITLKLDGHVERASLDAQLRQVMDLLNACGSKLQSIESEEHNLERLFLKLTGKRLRD